MFPDPVQPPSSHIECSERIILRGGRYVSYPNPSPSGTYCIFFLGADAAPMFHAPGSDNLSFTALVAKLTQEYSRIYLGKAV